jgi:hypothetical protein
MNDLGAGGIKIGDFMVPGLFQAQTSGNQVTDNRVHDTGAVYVDAVGIWVGQTANNTIAHNEVFNTFYSGISVGWTFGFGASGASNNLVQYNNIHDIGQGMLSDLGCVYTLGSQPATTISYNVCNNVSRYWYGAFGLYMDLGSQSITMQNNLAYNTQDGGFISHFSQNDTVTNNILALGQNYQLGRSQPTGAQSFDFEHNLVYWTQGDFLIGDWGDNGFLMDNNMYFCPGNCVTFGYPSLQQFFYLWQYLGHDPHSKIADPMFVDPTHGNFALKPGSPAPSIGFQPFDVSSAGPRP